MNNQHSLELIKRIKALSDAGLFYTENQYDIERFEELRDISKELLSMVTKKPLESFDKFYLPPKDYPTPKVDVRGLIINEDKKILMVKESLDQKWTIPGGWADIGYSPSEVVIKEISEETGLKAKVTKLLAVYDKKCHPHPPQVFYVYKMVFLCKVLGGELNHSFDIEDVDYFDVNKLPELSEDRIVKPQIEQLYKMALDNDNNAVHFD